MNLSVGIIGLPNVGKSTLFNALLSRQIADTSPYPFCTIEPNIGIVEIPDQRVQQIAKAESAAKTVHTVMKFVDIAGLVRGAHKGEGLGNRFLAHIREVNAIIHVLRFFDDETVNQSGSSEPTADYQVIQTELILADLATLEKQQKPKRVLTKEDVERWKVIQAAREALSEGIPLRNSRFTDEQKEFIAPLCLLTIKPELFVLNIDEKHLHDLARILAKFKDFEAIAICARLEEELAELTPDERIEYMESLGIKHSGLELLVQRSFEILDLVTFFTVNKNEARSRAIEKGTTAYEAASMVHTDIQEGFIKAAVVPYEVLVKHRGWKNSLAAGAVRFEGKNYPVKEGDVIEFRFRS